VLGHIKAFDEENGVGRKETRKKQPFSSGHKPSYYVFSHPILKLVAQFASGHMVLLRENSLPIVDSDETLARRNGYTGSVQFEEKNKGFRVSFCSTFIRKGLLNINIPDTG